MKGDLLLRIFLLFSLVVIPPSRPLMATGLPAEHELARLMLAVESAVDAGDWEQASIQLDQLQSLQLTLPDEFHYFYGLVMLRSGQPVLAQKSLERYVVGQGNTGRYYEASLKLITKIEQQPAPHKIEVPDGQPVPKLSSSSGDGYIRSLQALFLTDDPVQALVMHINSLLSAHAFNGSRIRKPNAREGVVYQLSVSGHDLVLQEKSFEQGQSQLRVSKLPVLGVDPYLTTGCEVEVQLCWVSDPTNNQRRWLVIDRDELVVRELSDALSKLIVRLQR
jgi:hypothetical protein